MSNVLTKKRVNPFPNKPWFLCACSTSLLKTPIGKGEIFHNEQFLLFQVFFTHLENCVPFSLNLKSSANSCCLEESQICYLGKG